MDCLPDTHDHPENRPISVVDFQFSFGISLGAPLSLASWLSGHQWGDGQIQGWLRGEDRKRRASFQKVPAKPFYYPNYSVWVGLVGSPTHLLWEEVRRGTCQGLTRLDVEGRMIGRGIDRPVCIPLLFHWEKNHDYEKCHECEKSQKVHELVMKRAMNI